MIRQKKNSGFTLAELLIVVAVVGILVAISIPVFTSQLHKAKVATDEANLRSYYSVLMADYQATGKYDYRSISGRTKKSRNNKSSCIAERQAIVVSWTHPEKRRYPARFQMLW